MFERFTGFTTFHKKKKRRPEISDILVYSNFVLFFGKGARLSLAPFFVTLKKLFEELQTLRRHRLLNVKSQLKKSKNWKRKKLNHFRKNRNTSKNIEKHQKHRQINDVWMRYPSHTAHVHIYPSVWVHTSLRTSSAAGDTTVSLHQSSDSKAQHTLNAYSCVLSLHVRGAGFLLSGQEGGRSWWNLVNSGVA